MSPTSFEMERPRRRTFCVPMLVAATNLGKIELIVAAEQIGDLTVCDRVIVVKSWYLTLRVRV